MREAGLPTSQQPQAQRSVWSKGGASGPPQPAGRQYSYTVSTPGGGSTTFSVQHSLTDDVPDHGPHWEAGEVKAGGQSDSLGRPRLTSGKSKVEE